VDDLSKLMEGLQGAGVSGDPAAAIGGLANGVMASGGLDALMGQLKAGGLGEAADSWVGTGPNQPVDPWKLGEALGPEMVDKMAKGSGLDVGALLPVLAAALPQVINLLTPDGKVPQGGLNNAASASGGDIGSLLGGLLGGGAGSGGAGGPDLGALLGGLSSGETPG
jgi:uncharacterized protein YidB (DUF937 family)